MKETPPGAERHYEGGWQQRFATSAAKEWDEIWSVHLILDVLVFLLE